MKHKKTVVFMVTIFAVIGFSLAIAFTQPEAVSSRGSPASASTAVNGAVADAGTLYTDFSGNSSGIYTTAENGTVGLPTLNGNGSIPSTDMSSYLFQPNLNASGMYTFQDGIVHPSYTQAPAPMGIGDFGVKKTSNGLSAYNLSTSSFEGTITIQNMQAFYPMNGLPADVSFQLNAILDNVTLLGSSSYSLITQNVIQYSTSTHQLQFLDNIWNMSNPTTLLSPNAIYSSTGNMIPESGTHLALGPAVKTNGSFTVSLYLNSTIINNRNALYFNYSIPQYGMSGTYDQVIFNSTYGAASQFVTPQANYLVSGNSHLENGALYDAELTIGGPDDFSTTNVMNINGTMTLKYMNDTTSSYNNVQSAFDYGADTGETSSGVSVYWTSNDVAHLHTGPSFLQGMWGVQSNSGAFSVTGKIDPSNGFMFINQGPVQNDLTAQWAPVQPSGAFSYMLSPDVYTAQILASDYKPVYRIPISGAAGLSILKGQMNLTRNDSYGGYTPLFAYSNSQLANISISGTGTASNPYVLIPQSLVSVVFGRWSLQGFPVFPGLLLYNTSKFVSTAGNPLALTILTMNREPVISGSTYLIDTMPLVFYKTEHVNVTGESVVGLFEPPYRGFYSGEITFIKSYNDTVTGNTFLSPTASSLIRSFGLSLIDSSGIAIKNNAFIFSIFTSVNSRTYLSGNTFLAGEDTSLFSTQYLAGNSFIAGHPTPELPLIQSALLTENSTVSVFQTNFSNSVIEQLGGNLELGHSTIQNSLIAESGTPVFLAGILPVGSELRPGPGTLSLYGDTLANCELSAPGTNVLITFSGLENVITEILNGKFTMMHSVADGFVLEATGSYVTVIGTQISNGSGASPLDPAVPYPWIISLHCSYSLFYGDTFITMAYNASLLNYYIASLAGSYNALTLVDGQSIVEHSVFLTVGGNQASDLIVASGSNVIEKNTFISFNVSRSGNLYGSGSSLIVYGGLDEIFGNRFISINSPAPSSYLGYGVYAKIQTNRYLYLENFGDSGNQFLRNGIENMNL